MFYFATGFLIGVILAGIFDTSSNEDKKVTTKIHEKHLRPKYYGYNGGYANTTKCNSCGLTGLYEDAHPANPCRKCGGKRVKNGAAKWDVKDGLYQWINSSR
tara:strand:- start:14796 stop:15101 length:306 start_codon:yes stop_codon:yes gene_type:complete